MIRFSKLTKAAKGKGTRSVRAVAVSAHELG